MRKQQSLGRSYAGPTTGGGFVTGFDPTTLSLEAGTPK
jgi:hypothetical protein